MTRGALAFDRQCEAAGLPVPVAELRFHPSRRWRFDWAWPNIYPPLAVEIDGAVYAGGRHVRGSGFEQDMEKLNEAQLLGWRVLRFSTGMVRDGRALGVMERALKADHRAECPEQHGAQCCNAPDVCRAAMARKPKR